MVDFINQTYLTIQDSGFFHEIILFSIKFSPDRYVCPIRLRVKMMAKSQKIYLFRLLFIIKLNVMLAWCSSQLFKASSKQFEK